jgi:hypothetical protein
LQRAAVASDEDDEDEGGAESDESDEEGVQLNADGELRTRDQRTADRAKITRFFVQTAAGTPTTPAQRHGDSPAGAGDEAISDIVDSTASEGVDEEASGEEEDEVRDASAGEDGGVEIQLAGGEGVGDDGFCSGEADSEEDADEDDSEDGSDDAAARGGECADAGVDESSSDEGGADAAGGLRRGPARQKRPMRALYSSGAPQLQRRSRPRQDIGSFIRPSWRLRKEASDEAKAAQLALYIEAHTKLHDAHTKLEKTNGTSLLTLLARPDHFAKYQILYYKRAVVVHGYLGRLIADSDQNRLKHQEAVAAAQVGVSPWQVATWTANFLRLVEPPPDTTPLDRKIYRGCLLQTPLCRQISPLWGGL